HRRSYLGLAEADEVKGPYKNKGIFLRSDYRNAEEFAAHPLDNGQSQFDGTVAHDVLAPQTRYDKDNNLCMVYGSYSGGIFVLAMDETTGKPEAGQGYGKRLLGGDFRAIEGAFVIYSPVADYYYLFYSVAGFASDGGYNIRIARSKNPDGPYYDPAGNDIADAPGLEIGAKLMGGFEFTHTVGEHGRSWGYLSPGHNSAYYDAATGRHILVTHSRLHSSPSNYVNTKETHTVPTPDIFVVNADWLIASLQRYVPLEGESREMRHDIVHVVVAQEIPGYYKF